MRHVFPSKVIIGISLVLTLLSLSLPYFPRVLLGVVSLIILPGFVMAHHLFNDKNMLRNLTFGLFLSLVLLTLFGAASLTLLSTRTSWLFLGLYFVVLFILDFLGKEKRVFLETNLERYDKYFLGLLIVLLVSVAWQSYFLGYQEGGDFVSKFTRNDHWYYAASSAVVRNEGLSSYPTYPHLPPEKDRYPIGSFILFGILSMLLNVPALYLVQYLGVLVPLGLSLIFYYGSRLFFKDKKTAFFAFLFGTVFHLGWSFFFSPASWYRYQNVPIPGWVVPVSFVMVCVFTWLLSRLYLRARKVFFSLIIVSLTLGSLAAGFILKNLSAKLSASMTWLIPILYYDWTYDSSFAGMLPLQVFFTTISPKALSFLYQAFALLILYKIIQEKEKRCWQVLLFLDILLMSVNHPSSFLPFALFLAIFFCWSVGSRGFNRLWSSIQLWWSILLGGFFTIMYGVYYAYFIAPGKSYLIVNFGWPYPLGYLFAFIVFYGFHWVFSFFGVHAFKNKKEVLYLLLIYVISHWIFIFSIKNTFNILDSGRVLSGTLIPLAFLSAAGVSQFNQKVKKEWKLAVWGVLGVLGVCYFLIYPLNFSPLQPNQYVVPRADLEAYQWIQMHTDPSAIFVVSLNDSEYNSHELTVFGERKTLIDSPWNLKLYGYPSLLVNTRKALVEEVYRSGLSQESLKKLRVYVDETLGKVPIYIFIGNHELEKYPGLAVLDVNERQVVFNNKEAVLVQV
ncbi:MAG: hypothetical protein AABX70_00515 [Nanoarchaeota archaeon]